MASSPRASRPPIPPTCRRHRPPTWKKKGTTRVAVTTRPVVNTGGAGDALFSAFVHVYAYTRDPDTALRTAIVFASHKIGEAGATQGFLDARRLDALYRRTLND